MKKMAGHQYEESSCHVQESQYQENPSSFYDVLYCSEQNWEEQVVREGYFQEEEPESYSNICNNNKNQNFVPILLEQDLSWEGEELPSLFAKEEQNQLNKNIETNPHLAGARSEAVEWMLKVNAHYSFTALTAVLAVNYFDRFLCGFNLQTEKPWMTQLAAVACLSLAAKVEETQVPLLLDLQVEDSRYVFEAKTIQRMEIVVLSTLNWKMNPVTPLSFLDYITRRLGLKDFLCWEFLRRCDVLLLSVISDVGSMQYVPSVIAAATMLHVIDGVGHYLEAECQSQVLGILGIEKDKVESCSKFIMDLATREHGNQSNKRKFCSIPGSPNGVMEVSFSSDSSNDSWAVASSVTSSPEHLSKKSRTVQDSTENFLTIPS